MTTEASRQLGLEIYEILREARESEKKDNRGAPRYAFFRPVTIQIGKIGLSGFCRELSEIGIGLMHQAKLTPCELEVAIPTAKGYSVHVRTRIIWCELCGEGWYISGGEFIGISRIGA